MEVVMKRSLLSLIMVAGDCRILFAEKPSTPNIPLTEQRLDLIRENLVICLESGIPNLQSSAEFMLRQVKAIALNMNSRFVLFRLCAS